MNNKINTVEIAHFKAFDASINFNIQGKNVLIFGDNGAGKTSLYDAFRVAYFSDKIEAEVLQASDTPEERHQKKQDLYNSFKNVLTPVPISIKINNVNHTSLDRSSYNVFMISRNDLELSTDAIYIQDLLSKMYFDYYGTSVQEVLKSIYAELKDEVNNCLQNEFSETVQIDVDPSDRYRCILSDMNGKLRYGKNIYRYFNEGKVHLILLIIFINTILLIKKDVPGILILDDFITSLDAANRAFVLRYLFKHMNSFQILILTHNVSFYNLIKHYINKHTQNKEIWLFYNLYTIGKIRKIYPQKEDCLESIKKELSEDHPNIEEIGNRVRQLFEIEVHKLSKILMVGSLEETNIVIDKILSNKPLYSFGESDVFDLVSSIENTAKQKRFIKNPLSTEITRQINKYKNTEAMSFLKNSLDNMVLFQKVALHPTSHGTIGRTPVTIKELNESIKLLSIITTNVTALMSKSTINNVINM